MTAAGEIVRGSARTTTVFGTAILVLGVLSIMTPMISGLAVNLVVAVLLIAAGITMTAYTFKAGSFWRGLFQFLFGGVSVLAGLAMLGRPLIGLASVTMILAVYFVVDGIMAIVLGFKIKPLEGWVWMIFSGIMAVVLGVLIYREWPVSGQYAIGILVGVRLIMSGFSMIMVGGVGEATADALSEPAGS